MHLCVALIVQLWPFKVVNERGKPVIEVRFKGEIKRFKPEEISAMVSPMHRLLHSNKL